MKNNEALLSRRVAAVPRGVFTTTSAFADRAENAELWDVEGRRYIDFSGGIGTLATGHRHPRVIEAAMAQMARFTHTAFQVMAYEPYVALAERLNQLAPFDGDARTVFFTTGAEAVENAVKLARAYTGRPAVIAFNGGFHGRTMLGTTLTGKVTPYKRGYGPMMPDVFHMPFPMPYRGIGIEQSLAALDALFQCDIDANRVAAIIIEPVQGEGGFHVAPPALLESLRVVCDRHGILLIADEIQSGYGRTGRMFAIEHADVEPDLVAVAKSLAGGFPLSGVIGRAAIMDHVEPGALGGTYGGFPVACGAGLAVLDVIEEEGLLERAVEIGTRLRARIAAMTGQVHSLPIANLRGLGAMVGFDILDQDGRPDGAMAKRVCARAFELGLVLLGCGTSGETIRVLMPLTIEDGVLSEGLDMLERALSRPEA